MRDEDNVHRSAVDRLGRLDATLTSDEKQPGDVLHMDTTIHRVAVSSGIVIV